MSAETIPAATGAWPHGCIKRSSCARNRACMYGWNGSCQHAQRDIRCEVEAASADRSNRPAEPAPEVEVGDGEVVGWFCLDLLAGGTKNFTFSESLAKQRDGYRYLGQLAWEVAPVVRLSTLEAERAKTAAAGVEVKAWLLGDPATGQWIEVDEHRVEYSRGMGTPAHVLAEAFKAERTVREAAERDRDTWRASSQEMRAKALANAEVCNHETLRAEAAERRLAETAPDRERLVEALSAIKRGAIRCRNPQSYRDFAAFAEKTTRAALPQEPAR